MKNVWNLSDQVALSALESRRENWLKHEVPNIQVKLGKLLGTELTMLQTLDIIDSATEIINLLSPFSRLVRN